ncbi:MAG: cytochrome c3 family protein [Burkholderiaceae bacterium]
MLVFRLAILLRLGLLVIASFVPATAAAVSLESLLSPGPLIGAHARFEEECSACHARFDRSAQNELCLACHQEVANDIAARTGLHGRRVERECRICHTDHAGRRTAPSTMRDAEFDHRQTDFTLRGAHTALTCTACHRPNTRRRDAPSTCHACHREQDVHQGALGNDCASCHTEKAWNQARFDHGKTGFPLTGAHMPLRCDSCHATRRYDEADKTCVSCHAKDDRHQKRFGPGCADCHSTTRWSDTSFDHRRDARFALRGRHAAIECQVCHTAPVGEQRLASACIACHRDDDAHESTLGSDCASCHDSRAWKPAAGFEHDKTRFPLRNAHARKPVRCASCHQSPKQMRDTVATCVSCHRADDRHDGRLGPRCEQCHDDSGWANSRFDHSRTRFALLGRHAATECKACHRNPDMGDTPTRCEACHADDDDHGGRLGSDCQRCHNPRDWGSWHFNHARSTGFALDGAHRRSKCESCHVQPVKAGAPIPRVDSRCGACHVADDVHDRRFGLACQRCHSTETWSEPLDSGGRR